MKLFISKKPSQKGGGSNTFAYNCVKWAKKNGHKAVSKIQKAEKAIIIANFSEVDDLREAKKNGCYIIHRIDEYFSNNEDNYRQIKHKKIHDLNQFADVTVFQSVFTYNNANPFLKPKRYEIILNGADPHMFYPGSRGGHFIGHVTWGLGEKQRLDILHNQILKMPTENFLLIGRHKEATAFDFSMPNVKIKKAQRRGKMPAEYRNMKVLFYPSQNDPCSNTIIEAIMSGVPVCYNNPGGASELVRDCGTHIDQFDELINNLEEYRHRCLIRQDLFFDNVMNKYMSI